MYSIKSLNRMEHSYETPFVSLLHCQNEGILCASYGEAGAAGKILTEENSWDM